MLGRNEIMAQDFNRSMNLNMICANDTAMPNPAQTWVVFNYTLPEDAKTSAVVTITDMLDTVVGQFETGSAAGEHVWNCTDVKSGVYYYTIVCDGLKQTGKLVIAK